MCPLPDETDRLWIEPGSAPDEEQAHPVTKRRRRGATAIEYCMIASLISVAVIAGVQAVGQNTVTLFQDIDTEIEAHK